MENAELMMNNVVHYGMEVFNYVSYTRTSFGNKN